MSPHDMTAWRADFDSAAAAFGWRKVAAVRHGERDDCSWPATVWQAADGTYLFEEADLTEGLCRELIRVAGVKGT